MAKVINKGNSVIDSPFIENRKTACLTLDLEQDYGDLLEKPGYEGLEHIPELVNLLKQRGLPLTCFVQGSPRIPHIKLKFSPVAMVK